jgi:hypothetical protein
LHDCKNEDLPVAQIPSCRKSKSKFQTFFGGEKKYHPDLITKKSLEYRFRSSENQDLS